MNYVVVSDSHINPAFPNVKDWKQLGRVCASKRVDYIIHLGDVADFDSLARFKINRGVYTTEEELATVTEHLDAFEAEIKAVQDKNRKDHKTIYRPNKVLCLGNHDVRSGYTGVKELFESRGWKVYDYLEPASINGIVFSHCMMRGLSEMPCTTAEELLENWHCNCVVGHSHVQDYAESFNLQTQQTIRALKCPVFNPTDSGWAVQTRSKWARGYTLIDWDGTDFQFIWRPLRCLYK